jgi:hypothetical protein
VWRSLNDALGWNSILAAGTNKRAIRYEAYVVAAHSWAKTIMTDSFPVSGEDIECALFMADGDLSRLGPTSGAR